jgi:hypothetical protein
MFDPDYIPSVAEMDAMIRGRGTPVHPSGGPPSFEIPNRSTETRFDSETTPVLLQSTSYTTMTYTACCSHGAFRYRLADFTLFCIRLTGVADLAGCPLGWPLMRVRWADSRGSLPCASDRFGRLSRPVCAGRATGCTRAAYVVAFVH